MFNDSLTWLGGGLVLLILYIIISNTLWLLFGSKLIQCLPGVNIKGFRGTIKIATMIVLSIIGSLKWLLKYLLVFFTKKKPNFSEEIRKTIEQGVILFNKQKQKKN